jgi:nitrite reductase/ring-hydroxylating ferredoxin subunit
MERRLFLKAGCLACAGAVSLSMLESCSTLPMFKAKPVNGLLEVPASAFADKNMVIVRANELDFDVLLVKEATGYRALYMKCTHEAAPLAATNSGLFCSMHGSTFNLSGDVTKEPALKPLTRFETTVTNQTIIINSNKVL